MYIVTAFALNYSTQNLGLPRELFLNIGLLVGGLSCLTIPCFAWLADRFGRRRIYITGALIGTLSGFPFFMALESQSVFWILFFALMLANIAHDMVVCVQQPMFTELFGASYRYSGAGVGYQVASVVGGGFTPFIAAALVTFSGGSWHSVALYLTAGCLLSALTALLMKKTDRPLTHLRGRDPRPPVRRMHVSVIAGRLLASPFYPPRWRCSFARTPPRRNSRCLPKPAPGKPSPSSGRRRRDLWCRGSYRRFADLPAVSAHFAARGWPVWPAAPGASWCLRGRELSTLASPGRCSSRSARPPNPSITRCALVLQRTLARFGVASHARAVNGSFCDGRYNLACGEGEAARKIVGTAQYWRPLTAGRGHVVLAHAVIPY